MRQWLVEYIDHAFCEVRLEEGITIYEAESMDLYGDPWELELAKTAERMDWRHVPAEHLVLRNGLVFLDAQGFRFYTPAIMTLVLRGEDALGNLTQSFVFRLADLSKTGKVCGMPYHYLFNRVQRAAIRRYVKFFIHNVPYGWSNSELVKILARLNKPS